MVVRPSWYVYMAEKGTLGRMGVEYRTRVRYAPVVAELLPHEVELLRRSVAIITPCQPSGINRETALQILRQLQDVTRERDRLAQELAECVARHPSRPRT